MSRAGKSDGSGPEALGGARITVCAGDDTLRERVEGLLTDAGHDVVHAGGSLEGLAETVRVTNPELVVLAYAFEPFSTSSDIRMLRASLGQTPLVIIGSGPLSRGTRKVILSQAEGLLDEMEVDNALVATVDCVLADQICLPADFLEHLARPVFSYREKQVLELVLGGLTNGEIASRLFLSESTVKSHLASSFRKLGVSSRAEAAQRVLDPDSSLELKLQPTPDHRTPQLI